MYSRHVNCNLKPIKRDELAQMFDREILPLLQKQNGFNDEIVFADQDGRRVLAISLWENKENADTYTREVYPQVLKTLGRVIEGTPQVREYEVAFSTLHKTSPTIQTGGVGSALGKSYLVALPLGMSPTPDL